MTYLLLYFAKGMSIPSLHIFGDSSLVINSENNKASLCAFDLSHWCESITNMLACFYSMDIQHVYREYNMRVDGLSKYALSLAAGHCSFIETYEEIIIGGGDLQRF